MNGCALITCANGGIVQVLVRAFDQAGYVDIVTDLSGPPGNLPCKYLFG